MNDWDSANTSGIPRLTNDSIADAAQQLESDCVIDAIYPGRPLIISFNYFTQQKEFDMFGYMRKLENRVGAPFNRIYLRDSKDKWFQFGVKGLGGSVNEVAQKLSRLIRFIAPSEVITIGQSMGGYAAILYGILLQADRAIGFGPLSNLDPRQHHMDGDVRWLPLMTRLYVDRPDNWFPDIVSLALSSLILPDLHIVAGTHPIGTGSLPNKDKTHIDRFAKIPGVSIYEYPEAQHEVSVWLAERKLLDDLLYQMIVEPKVRESPPIHIQSGENETRQYATVNYTN